MGFIFRKVHKPEMKDKVTESVTNGLTSPLLVHGSFEPEPEPVLVNGFGGGSLEDEAMASQDSSEQTISLDASLLGAEGLEEG